MAIQVSGTTIIDNSRNMNGLSTFRLPQLSSAPSSPSSGDSYYNTTDGIAYVYVGNAWQPMHSVPVAATGGDSIYTSGGYKYHKFTSSGTFSVSNGGDVDYMIVAGGAGGGCYYYSGGGGAGV